jgi:hypothetical protein
LCLAAQIADWLVAVQPDVFEFVFGHGCEVRLDLRGLAIGDDPSAKAMLEKAQPVPKQKRFFDSA